MDVPLYSSDFIFFLLCLKKVCDFPDKFGYLCSNKLRNFVNITFKIIHYICSKIFV